MRSSTKSCTMGVMREIKKGLVEGHDRSHEGVRREVKKGVLGVIMEVTRKAIRGQEVINVIIVFSLSSNVASLMHR